MTEVNRTKFKVANKTDDTFELTDVDDSSDVDTSGYTTYSSGGEVRKCVTSVSGLSHLAGETVDVICDGDVASTAVVSGAGVVTITSPVTGGGEVHIGLRYTPYYQSMRVEGGSLVGTAQGKFKSISKVIIRLFESLKAKIGNILSQDEYSFRDLGDSTTNTIEVFSGDQEVPMPANWDRDGYIIITQDGPYPLNITSITYYLNVSDD
jgi:hypothetical protein